ncbi:MAG: hypothetical protein EON56_01240 [Alphaproteobacteria bacterium]|nr:MAG: hypothetical protein EON56_01240 [Alphaproteobacteria bacterium]
MNTAPDRLPDEALLQRARFWRLSAMRGVRGAREIAHWHEAEVRRRFTDHQPSSQVPTRSTPLQSGMPWCSLWRRFLKRCK